MSDKFSCLDYSTAGLIACAYQDLGDKQPSKELNEFAKWCLKQSKAIYFKENHE